MTQTVYSTSYRLLVFSLSLAALLQDSTSVNAITILSGPTFTKALNAPLAGRLQLTTDLPSRVSVYVDDGDVSWRRDFHDYATTHSIPLFGFQPGNSNVITVTVLDSARNQFTSPVRPVFVTDPLPADFPVINVLASNPSRMEPGYTLLRPVNNNNGRAYLAIVDNAGSIVWYSANIPSTLDVRQLADGNLFLPETTNFIEANLLGETVKSWSVPSNLAIDFHDGVPTDVGSILYIHDEGRIVTNFPSSSTDPNAPRQTTSVMFNSIIEISATNSALLNRWSLIDMLDPLRIDYLTFTISTSLGWDSEHANAVIEDPRDNSIIVSLRHQDAVIKFLRTGRLKWILGPHENWSSAFQSYLLNPVSTPFQWNYAQHAPMITPQGTLLIYDDGNFRASPFDASIPDQSNYSRAVEYSIDEEHMEVSQVWEYGSDIDQPLYTSRVGNADWLPKSGNVLVVFGNVDWINHAKPSPYTSAATMARIKEVTHEQVPEVLFDLAIFDYNNTNSTYKGSFTYRAHRIPDLYAHPAQPVADLTIDLQRGVPHLQFSADATRTYAIEASTDLASWTEIGTPVAGSFETFDFEDTTAPLLVNRYYRVVTK